MKHFSKILFLLTGFFTGTTALHAQDCASGYCPANVVVHHIQGKYSAQTVDLTYNFREINGTDNNTYCWLDRNIGASAKSATYNSDPATTYGWYYPWLPHESFPPTYTTNGVFATYSVTGVYQYDVDPLRTTDLSSSDKTDLCSVLFGSSCVTPSQTEITAIFDSYSTSVTTAGAMNDFFNYFNIPASGYSYLQYNSVRFSTLNITTSRAYSSSNYGVYYWIRDYGRFNYCTYGSSYTKYMYNSKIYTYLNSLPYGTLMPRRCIIKI